jgi:hypothetical protein
LLRHFRNYRKMVFWRDLLKQKWESIESTVRFSDFEAFAG